MMKITAALFHDLLHPFLMIHLASGNLDSHFKALSSITEKMYLYRVSEKGQYSSLEQILKNKTNVQSHLNNHLYSLETAAIFCGTYCLLTK